MASQFAATVDANGISAPDYATVLANLKAAYQSIYGADAYLEADSQDGQFLAIIASAINDCNATAISVYNAFSPATAQGNGLSSVVKINGLTRQTPSYSTADLTIIGVAGTTISNGIVQDANSNNWALPASVTIPSGGEITVTATCQTAGAITAGSGTITNIQTHVYGWQSATNANAASAGNPVEKDPALRVRQAASVAIPSQTVLAGIVGAIEALSGVEQVRAYENDTESADANGIPAHAISIVIEGGDASAIASIIALKKTPGGPTYGTTTVAVTDSSGASKNINFYRPTSAPITVAVALKALAGYTSSVGTDIQNAIAAYVNSVLIGGGSSGVVEWDSSIAAAKSVLGAGTFKITSLTLTGPRGAGSPDVALLFNEMATCSASSVTLAVS